MNDKFSLEAGASINLALTDAALHLEQSGAFFGHGTDSAWDESVSLLLWAMGLKEDPGESALSQVINQPDAEKFVASINQRAREKIPAAYITNEAWFCGLKFYVDTRVLVPRSPIAEIIGSGYRPWLIEQPRRILDLCCGSGCIGLAAAFYDEASEVVLSDLSVDALEVARKNLDLFDLHSRVNIYQGDLFQAVENKRFDLILSNPPYVNKLDIDAMPLEYQHEPAMGLGSGEDGLDITRRILAEAPDYLAENGSLILEVGNSSVSLERAFPGFPFTWISFAHGGDGVCVLTREELLAGPF